MGESDITVHELLGGKHIWNMYKNKGISCSMEFIDLTSWNKYTFIDYVYGGLTTSLYVGCDFSLGNKSWKDRFSLHYVDEH